MGFFDRFKPGGSGTPLPPVNIRRDVACGDGRGSFFHAQLKDGKWQKVYEMLQKIDDWVLLDEYIDLCADWKGRPEWLDEIAAVHPDQSLTWVLRGMHSVIWAWEARGGGVASTVGRDSFEVFFERLRQAEGEFHRAITLDPNTPIPWSYMVTVARGLQYSIEDRINFFHQAVGRSPLHLQAYAAALVSVAAKWGGSNELMFDLARQATSNPPPQSALPSLIPLAHVERWLYHRMQDEMDLAKEYFRQPEVIREITAAHARYDGYSGAITGVRLANLFAFCFWKIGNRKLTRHELEKTGGIVVNSPWHFQGNALEQYRGAWKWAFE
jgi:hypothetical protein